MPTYTKFPVSSFGPELLQLLVDGTRQKKEIELEVDGMTHAVALRRATSLVARLNALRAAMRREKHQYADMVMRAKCKKDGTKVIVEPRDSEFSSAIKKAGVVPIHEELPGPPIEQSESEPPNEGKVSSRFDLSSPQPSLEMAIDNFLTSISIKD